MKRAVSSGFTLIELPKAVRQGFTLIELLVVVTIIIVLLALLVPAMDKAIYQAELTVCGTHLKGIGTGALTYTLDFKRYYPVRFPLTAAKNARGPDLIYIKNTAPTAANFDERMVIKNYINLDGLLSCPLAKKVVLTSGMDGREVGSTAYSTYGIFSSYALWYGWTYKDETQGMRRLGDRFEWQGDGFNVLAMDKDIVFEPNYAQAAHPDKTRIMSNTAYQDEIVATAAAGQEVGIGAAGAAKYTFSFWEVFKTINRGPIDRNQTYDDGSVARLLDVTVDDPRMVAVPGQMNYADFPRQRTWLPKTGAQ